MMPTGLRTDLLRHLRAVVPPDTAAVTDGQLLTDYVEKADDAAFAALVRRHGPMVWAVCRRALHSHHDAEDAFQAVFLVLARRAATVMPRDRVVNWLHGVAFRTARKARASAARRRAREVLVVTLPEPSGEPGLPCDLLPLLDEELSRLPDRYRAVALLCDLQGATRREASRQLGLPEGTVASRLASARALLARRLARRGITAGGAALVALLRGASSAAAPLAAVGIALNAASVGTVPVRVAALAEGVWRTLFMDKLKRMFATLIAVATLGSGAGWLGYRAQGTPPPETEPPPAAAPSPPLAVPLPRPVIAARPPEGAPHPGSHRTANFVVSAPSPHAARRVAEAAELHRTSLAQSWLGRELPPWPEPCLIRVELRESGGGGASDFAFDQGKVLRRNMHLMGTLDTILWCNLPHELTHLVLADAMRRPVPRWADEGAALLAEDGESQQQHLDLAAKCLAAGRTLPLERLLALKDYPNDVRGFYAQSAALTRFLVDRKDRATFLAFVKQGATGTWEEALRTHYDCPDVASLEKEWRAWLAGMSPTAASPTLGRRLPVAPAPITALAQVLPGGALVVRSSTVTYTPRPLIGYEREVGELQRAFDLGEVQAYGADGKSLGAEEVTRRLARETAVLVAADGQTVDPFYLQLVKEGTVVLVLPRSAR